MKFLIGLGILWLVGCANPFGGGSSKVATNYGPDLSIPVIPVTSGLVLWLDASDATKITLQYNSLATTATGSAGSVTFTASSNAGLVVGARIKLGGAVTTALASVTQSSDPSTHIYTVTSIAGTTIGVTPNLTQAYAAVTLYQGYVTQIVDKSSNALLITQITAALMPLWISNGMNNLGTINFDGSNDVLSALGSGIAVTDATFGAVVATTDTSAPTGAGGYGVLGLCQHGVDIFDAIVYGEFAANVYHNGSNGFTRTPSTVTAADLTVTSPHVIINRQTSSSFVLIKNGTVASSTAVYSSMNKTNLDITLGIRSTSAANGYLKGNISEVFVYNSALSSADRKLVEAYIGSKWNISVAP